MVHIVNTQAGGTFQLKLKLHLSFPPSSSILIRSFMSWSWLQRSSISTGFPTCRSSVTASREDAQMTLYSEGPNCDLLILFFIASQTHTYTYTHTRTHIRKMLLEFNI